MTTKAELEKNVEVEAQKIAEESFGEYDSLEDEEANAFMAIVSDFKSGASFVTGILMPEIEMLKDYKSEAETRLIAWKEGHLKQATDFLDIKNKLEKELSKAKETIEYLKSGVHTCHDQCQKPICVKLRDKDATIQSMKDERDNAIKAMDHHINCDMRTQEKIQSLKDEIEVLRRYGNKDCTAMADEALTKKAEE